MICKFTTLFILLAPLKICTITPNTTNHGQSHFLVQRTQDLMQLPKLQTSENEKVWSQRAWLLLQLLQAMLCKWCLRRKKHFRNKKKKHRLSFQGRGLLLHQLLNYIMFCPDDITVTKAGANVAFILKNHNHSPVAQHTPTLRYSPILWSCITKQIWTHGH